MVTVDNLVKDYGSFRAVDGVSFEVKKGDILGFLGPNGAGKSTTMKMLTGFLAPTSGRAEVDGFDVWKKPLLAKSRIGYLPESGPLYGEMTVGEFIRFIAETRGFSGTARAAKVDAAMELCSLDEVRHQTIETLSKGFRQRVGFAQAILHNPPVLVLDEPTDGLDPNQKQEVRKIILNMAGEKAIILSTHILEEVESLCNRVVIISKGKKRVDETPQSLRQRNANFNALRLKVEKEAPEAVKSALKGLPFVDSVKVGEGDALLVFPKQKQEISEKILATCSEKNWRLLQFEKLPARLDSVFADLTT